MVAGYLASAGLLPVLWKNSKQCCPSVLFFCGAGAAHLLGKHSAELHPKTPCLLRRGPAQLPSWPGTCSPLASGSCGWAADVTAAPGRYFSSVSQVLVAPKCNICRLSDPVWSPCGLRGVQVQELCVRKSAPGAEARGWGTRGCLGSRVAWRPPAPPVAVLVLREAGSAVGPLQGLHSGPLACGLTCWWSEENTLSLGQLCWGCECCPLCLAAGRS